MGESYMYNVKTAKNEEEAQMMMNDMARQGWRVKAVSPMEGKWTWSILITFEKAFIPVNR